MKASGRESVVVRRSRLGDPAVSRGRRGILFAGFLSEVLVVLVLIGGVLITLAMVSGRRLTDEMFHVGTGGATAGGLSASPAHVNPIYHLSPTHDFQHFVICTQRREVLVGSMKEPHGPRWSLTTGRVPAVIACSPVDDTLVIGNIDGSISMCETRSAAAAETIGTIEAAHLGMVLCLGFSKDGTLFASGSNDGVLHLWDRAGVRRRSFDVPPGIVQCLRFTSDGRKLAAACSDNSVRIWDLAQGCEVRRLTGHAAAVMDFDFLREETVLITGGLDQTLRLWDLATGRELWRSAAGAIGPVFAIAASPDDARAACGDLNGRLYLFDLGMEEFIAECEAHQQGVRCLTFTLEGETLFSAGYDGTLGEWDIRTMRLARRF